MTIKYTGSNIALNPDTTTVKVDFEVDGIDEAKALIEGCKSLGARGTVTQETPKPKKGKKTEPALEPAADPDEDEDDEDDEDEEEEEDKKPAAADDDDEDDEDDDEDEEEEKPAKPSGPPPKIKVTKDMVKAERFRHVVEALIKQGVKSKSQLIKICNKIKDQVPCVAKVSNIEERIQSCLEMIGTTLAD